MSSTSTPTVALTARSYPIDGHDVLDHSSTDGCVWLAAGLSFVTTGVAQTVALGDASSTVADVYPDTPAAGAGLSADDTITSVDGTSVSTSTALRDAIKTHDSGDTVRVTWTDSAGDEHSASLTLVEGPVG